MLALGSFAALALLQADAPPMECRFGPGQYEVAGHVWLAIACSDRETLLLIAAEPNPAAPFLFIFSPSEAGYDLRGEGNSPRDVTASAFESLRQYDEQRIRELVDELLSEFDRSTD